MWRNFGALMGAVSKITGPRVIQPGSVITRRTRDPRVPPVVFNFSVCSCTYPCVRARANMDGVEPCFARFSSRFTGTARSRDRFLDVFASGCGERGGGCAAFSTRKIVNPSISRPFFPPRCTIKRFLVVHFFLRIKREKFWERFFENFLTDSD